MAHITPTDSADTPPTSDPLAQAYRRAKPTPAGRVSAPWVLALRGLTVMVHNSVRVGMVV